MNKIKQSSSYIKQNNEGEWIVDEDAIFGLQKKDKVIALIDKIYQLLETIIYQENKTITINIIADQIKVNFIDYLTKSKIINPWILTQGENLIEGLRLIDQKTHNEIQKDDNSKQYVQQNEYSLFDLKRIELFILISYVQQYLEKEQNESTFTVIIFPAQYNFLFLKTTQTNNKIVEDPYFITYENFIYFCQQNYQYSTIEIEPNLNQAIQIELFHFSNYEQVEKNAEQFISYKDKKCYNISRNKFPFIFCRQCFLDQNYYQKDTWEHLIIYENNEFQCKKCQKTILLEYFNNIYVNPKLFVAYGQLQEYFISADYLKEIAFEKTLYFRIIQLKSNQYLQCFYYEDEENKKEEIILHKVPYHYMDFNQSDDDKSSNENFQKIDNEENEYYDQYEDSYEC